MGEARAAPASVHSTVVSGWGACGCDGADVARLGPRFWRAPGGGGGWSGAGGCSGFCICSLSCATMGARFIREGGPGIPARALGKSFFQPHSAVGHQWMPGARPAASRESCAVAMYFLRTRSDGERLVGAEQLIISASLEALWVSSGLGAARSKPIHRRPLRHPRDQ